MAQNQRHWVRSIADALNLTTSIVASIAICYFGGSWLDTKFDTEPWLAILGFFLGLATAMKLIWDRMNADIKRDLKNKEDEEKP